MSDWDSLVFKPIKFPLEEVQAICKDCIWYYKEHCSNGNSEYCTEMVSENDTCKEFES